MAVSDPWLSQDPMGPASDRGYAPQPAFRDQMDALRSQWGTPAAQYPDGVGLIAEERRRRLTNPASTFDRNTFMRGANKGGQIDPALYIWPRELNIMTGIELQAQGKRFAPLGQYVDAASDRSLLKGAQLVDEQAKVSLGYLRPNWA